MNWEKQPADLAVTVEIGEGVGCRYRATWGINWGVANLRSVQRAEVKGFGEVGEFLGPYFPAGEFGAARALTEAAKKAAPHIAEWECASESENYWSVGSRS